MLHVLLLWLDLVSAPLWHTLLVLQSWFCSTHYFITVRELQSKCTPLLSLQVFQSRRFKSYSLSGGLSSDDLPKRPGQNRDGSVECSSILGIILLSGNDLRVISRLGTRRENQESRLQQETVGPLDIDTAPITFTDLTLCSLRFPGFSNLPPTSHSPGYGHRVLSSRPLTIAHAPCTSFLFCNRGYFFNLIPDTPADQQCALCSTCRRNGFYSGVATGCSTSTPPSMKLTSNAQTGIRLDPSTSVSQARYALMQFVPGGTCSWSDMARYQNKIVSDLVFPPTPHETGSTVEYNLVTSNNNSQNRHRYLFPNPTAINSR
ncbi:hypothetical protein BJX61DRAFT_375542 [Aspergillus egyptiacus]|nr:hypothetical protein BJX61DRAFT_375542 [Aspergillus egyptiacus]